MLLLLDEVKDSLLTCDVQVCPRLQGQAEAYKKMLRDLERASITSEAPRSI